MNADWSNQMKLIQDALRKEATFQSGIQELIGLRQELMNQISSIVNTCPAEAFLKQPYPNVKGYHSKTLAYSIWHVFRIEDIVAHTLINGDEQILFREGYQARIGAPLITTGNELEGDAIAAFSAQLDVAALHTYAQRVMQSTNELLLSLTWPQLKRRFSEEDRQRLTESGCVSSDPSAEWLIGYWCGKPLLGLITMPFSRHWIMHIEAMLRIKNRLCQLARKGVDPVACCGFSCNHCFLSQWCGSCRSEYNTCSFAACSPDKICPNVACCRKNGLDGCWECGQLEGCTVGFYTPGNDGAQAAKAQALYIRRHGKKAFLAVHDKMHERYSFEKTQEILGQDLNEGLRILEECDR